MIEIKNISKSYGENLILKNINLTIKKNEVTFIVGTSGTGKTTLLNIIGGLDVPDTGSVLFDGKNIFDNIDEYRGKNVGFIFQDFNLVSGLSVKENIDLAVELSGNKDYKFDDKMLGIKDISQKVETLSGGEKQRVAIIRSVCKNADIIIADEPTGNLDSENTGNVLEQISELGKDKYIIIVSHDMENAEKYGDRIIRIKDGEVVEDTGTRSESKSDDEKEDSLMYGRILDRKRKKISMNSVWMLGKNSVRMRRSKIFSIALMIALTISLLVMVINFNNVGDELANSVNVNYLENDLVSLYYEATPNTSFKEKIFTQEVIDDLISTYAPKECVEIYLEANDTWIFSNKRETASVCLKQIDINEFFEERVMSNDIEGDFLKNKNEIILAKDVADTLFEGNCIGEEVFLCDDIGNSVAFTIVGVNHTTNAFDSIYSYVSSEHMKELLYQRILQNVEERVEVDIFYDEVQSVKTGGIYGGVRVYDDTLNVIAGKAPSDDSEIMISSEVSKYTAGLLNVEGDELYAKQLIIQVNGEFPVKICGIYDSEEAEIALTEGLIESMKSMEPTQIEMYVDIEKDSVTEIKEDINHVQEYVANTQLDNLKDNVMMQTRFFSLALIAIGFVLLLVSMALITSFAKIAILERKKEMAIVKSMGASDRNILLILLFDFGVIAVISLLLSFVISAILNAVILNSVDLMYAPGYPVLLVVLVNLIFHVLIIIYTALFLRRLVKIMPAKLLVVL